MAIKRFTTSSHHDPTITQKVRTLLYDAGHGDVVNEILVDGMRDVEQMARGGLNDHEKRLLMLEEAERDRLTRTTVIELIKAKAHSNTAGWVKWGTRAMLAGLGAVLLSALGLLLKLAWKGLHA